MDHPSTSENAALARDRAQAFALNQDSVSRETWDRLDAFVTLLLARQASMNLVGPSAIANLWTRHIADSLQLIPLAPGALRSSDRDVRPPC